MKGSHARKKGTLILKGAVPSARRSTEELGLAEECLEILLPESLHRPLLATIGVIGNLPVWGILILAYASTNMMEGIPIVDKRWRVPCGSSRVSCCWLELHRVNAKAEN